MAVVASAGDRSRVMGAGTTVCLLPLRLYKRGVVILICHVRKYSLLSDVSNLMVARILKSAKQSISKKEDVPKLRANLALLVAKKSSNCRTRAV